MPLQTPRPLQQYNCKQEELYQVCLLGWDSYLENVAAFTSTNTTYTLAFGQTSRTAVLTAKAMPDFQARDEASESFLILMKEAATQCLIQWNLLETHIKKSFPLNLHKPKLESAGADHYEKAAQNNWESVSALMESGKKFIAQNTAALTTGGMPAGFSAAFNTARTSFETLYTQFKDAQQDAEELRDDKINANNAIFSLLSSMFEDGQKIYRNNPAKRERFTFSKVLELVSGASPVSPSLVTLLTAVTDQSVLQGFNIGISGSAGDEASISWGDGNTNDITLDGTTQNIPHNYVAPGIYTIELKGNHPERIIEMLITHASLTNAQLADNLTALEVLNLEYNPVTNFILPAGLTALKYVSFFQDALNVTNINSILQIVNGFNTSPAGASMLLHGGTNAAPTGQGITAKTQLESRGWSVATN